MGKSLTFEEWLEKLDRHIQLLTYGLSLSDFRDGVVEYDLKEYYKCHYVMRSIACYVLECAGWQEFLDLDELFKMEWRNA